MRVTSENFGELLIASAKEAVEIARGLRLPAKIRTYQIIPEQREAADGVDLEEWKGDSV